MKPLQLRLAGKGESRGSGGAQTESLQKLGLRLKNCGEEVEVEKFHGVLDGLQAEDGGSVVLGFIYGGSGD